jgi:hypothetical protein
LSEVAVEVSLFVELAGSLSGGGGVLSVVVEAVMSADAVVVAAVVVAIVIVVVAGTVDVEVGVDVAAGVVIKIVLDGAVLISVLVPTTVELAVLDAGVNDGSSAEDGASVVDADALPICQTSVSPTFVIAPDVAKFKGKNPPQKICVPEAYTAELSAEKRTPDDAVVSGVPSAFAEPAQVPRQVEGLKSWTSAFVEKPRMPKKIRIRTPTHRTAQIQGYLVRNFFLKLRTLSA